jgi:hypothetical protein
MSAGANAATEEMTVTTTTTKTKSFMMEYGWLTFWFLVVVESRDLADSCFLVWPPALTAHVVINTLSYLLCEGNVYVAYDLCRIRSILEMVHRVTFVLLSFIIVPCRPIGTAAPSWQCQ